MQLSERQIQLSNKQKQDDEVLRLRLRKRLQGLINSNEEKTLNIIKNWLNQNPYDY